MNWVIAAFGGVGHLYSTRSKDLYNLNYAADFVAKKGISMQGETCFAMSLSRFCMESVINEEVSSDLGRRVRYDTNTARQHLKGIFSWGRNSLFSPVIMALETSLGEVVYIVYEVMKSLVLVLGRIFLPQDAYVYILESDMSVSTSNLYNTIATRLLQFQQFLAFRMGVVFTTSFLFFISTTLVSYILRQVSLTIRSSHPSHLASNCAFYPVIDPRTHASVHVPAAISHPESSAVPAIGVHARDRVAGLRADHDGHLLLPLRVLLGPAGRCNVAF